MRAQPEGILSAREFGVDRRWVWSAGQRGGEESVCVQTGEVKSRRVCFHLSGEARGESNRVFLPLPPCSSEGIQPLEF